MHAFFFIVHDEISQTFLKLSFNFFFVFWTGPAELLSVNFPGFNLNDFASTVKHRNTTTHPQEAPTFFALFLRARIQFSLLTRGFTDFKRGPY